jgi:hypothetical protein
MPAPVPDADSLAQKDLEALKLLIKFAGPSLTIRYQELRVRGFPELLEQIYNSGSEYLDSLANRKFQKLRDNGWLHLDGTGKITILFTP